MDPVAERTTSLTGHDALNSLGQARPRNRKRSELLAQDLASYIVQQRFPEGTALPPEYAMIDSLGVGRTTLREALRLLEARGVITIRSGPGGGPTVRRPRPHDLSEALSLILQFESSTFQDVLAARLQLEPLVARAAAANIGKRAVKELRAVNEAMSEREDDAEAFATLDQHFHSLVAGQCGNIVLTSFCESLLALTDASALPIDYGRPQMLAITESHEAIANALDARDADAAETTMAAHLDEITAYVRRRFNAAASRTVPWRQ